MEEFYNEDPAYKDDFQYSYGNDKQGNNKQYNGRSSGSFECSEKNLLVFNSFSGYWRDKIFKKIPQEMF